ncbi:MAG: glutamine--scyllo-inositol aminotransferase [Lentisphaerae bacterium RIFOXYA12_FULL_48_11]|nr:MAG: glutamine--scyllo-inositol aminotransferase [Lentisphaerae bacterium RIFOXYA12_FULL_48_11]
MKTDVTASVGDIHNKIRRRTFIKTSATAMLGAGMMQYCFNVFGSEGTMDGLALLGGKPVRKKGWAHWPHWVAAEDEQKILEVLRSGVWSRAGVVTSFEKAWAKAIGSKRCLAVVNGTNALVISLAQLDIGAGDEVILPPYTFIATPQSILMNGAIPVFCDVDPQTYQLDPKKVESKITSKTRAILPVHILGLPADMTAIMDIAKKHNLMVVEDACQGWLAEINGKKVGSFGNAGCYSFQNSKNMPIGEGGAIVSDDDAFMDRCYSYHNYGNAYGTAVGAVGGGTVMLGSKMRYTEYQAAIGLAMLKTLEPETIKRHANAEYLKSKIKDIPGIVPYAFSPGVNRAAFHLFPFRYKEDSFNGLSRDKFIKALSAEGVGCSGGYGQLNKQPFVKAAFQTKNFKRMYAPAELDYEAWLERTRCPENEKLCTEMVWLSQEKLLAEKEDMDDIANAIEKIHKHSRKLAKV